MALRLMVGAGPLCLLVDTFYGDLSLVEYTPEQVTNLTLI